MKHIIPFEDHINESVEHQLVKTGEKVADEIMNVLSPEEVEFLADYYNEEGREAVANQIASVEEEAMNPNEIKARKIIDKLIKYGVAASALAIVPAMMAGAPFAALGLGIAALAGTAMKDAAWWKLQGHAYKEQDKYGVK
jgi:hypothetical protein